MNTFLLAFLVVFIAETGDKTQFVALTFATRYRLTLVMAAILTSSLSVHLLSVALGEAVGKLVPALWINIFAGSAFIGFGLWTLFGKTESDQEETDKEPGKVLGRLGQFLSIALTFFVAELGDKTMLATVTIASQQHSFVAVWLGSSLGMFSANLLPLALGKFFGNRLPQKALRYAASFMFFSAGALTFFHVV